ncbi:MAG: pyridoxal-phosphate dependent enzyme, partial [Hyphomicrobiales bacterium]|nr:pyridoxal-phosphate dependent enzyme [Hyphomicrobiales bacterium]
MTHDRDLSCGIGRYHDRLPVDGPLVSLGEGNTPLLPLERLGAAIGLPRLFAKLENVNPTGSYKDRIAAVSITVALERGHRGWIATSSGNGGLSLAAYGARAGLSGILFTVANMPREKLLPLLMLGVEVHPVAGVGRGGTRQVEAAMFDAVQDAAERNNLFLGVTAHKFNPDGMRGVDTIAYEIHRDAAGAHAVYVPSGGGGLATAIARGLADQGASTRVVVCQPEGCAPTWPKAAYPRQRQGRSMASMKTADKGIVDGAQAEIIRASLLNVAEEMRTALVRTAFSPVIYEVRDFGISIYDRSCQLIAEAPGLTRFLGANDYAVPKVLDHVGVTVLEARTAMRVTHFELRPQSFGNGRFRGGPGL